MRAWIGATQFSTKESNDTTKESSNKKAAWFCWRVFKQEKQLDLVGNFNFHGELKRILDHKNYNFNICVQIPYYITL